MNAKNGYESWKSEHRCEGTVYNACKIVKNFTEHKRRGDEVYNGWNIILPRVKMKKKKGKRPVYRKDTIKTMSDFKFRPFCGEELL